tara:strand:+ start:9931 stop:12864 length:2934 start_codon:yes stop_codon:yes gene_type:complete
MGVPSTRTPVRIARGTYANLSTVDALAAIDEGEICFATDQGRLYVKQGAGLTSISSTNEVAPTPAEVTASPAFTGGTGTQSDPYLLTNVGSPFSGGSLTSEHELTISGTAGDIAVFTDNSPTASADRFKGQDVGILNAAGEFKLNLKYADNPVTTTDNTTYTGNLQIGTTHITWVVVQSNLAPLSEDTTTTITSGSGVGDVITATPGTATGGTAPHSSSVKWQRSFTGIDGWFDTGSTGTSYTIVSADAGYYVRAVATVTDSTDASQGGPLTIDLPSAASAQLNTNQVTTVSSLTLSEDNPAGSRYTSQTYSLDAVLNPDGTPTSTKSVKVKLEGTFDTYPQTDTVVSTTSGDQIANNVQERDLKIMQQGNNSNNSANSNWHAPLFIYNDTTQGFLNFTTNIGHGTSPKMHFTETKGMGNDDQPYHQDAVYDGNGDNIVIQGRYLWKPTWDTTDYRQWYQNESGSTTSQQMNMVKLYKRDTLMIYGSQGGFMYLKDIISNATDWQKHWTPVKDYQYPGGGGYNSGYTMDFVDIGDVRYNVFVNAMSTTGGYSEDGYVAVVTGDLTDPENQTSTEVSIDWGASPWAPSGSSGGPALQLIFTHGSKITIIFRYSVSSIYHYRFFTCDFSQNDGSDASHWVMKADLKNAEPGNQSNMGPGNVAVNPHNTDQIYVFFGQNSNANRIGYFYSADGGETYSSRPTPVVSGWSDGQKGVMGVIWHRGRILLVYPLYATWNGQGTGGSGTSRDNNRFWCFLQSSDTGYNWTVAQYNDNYPVARYGTYNGGPQDLISSQYFNNVVENGGWIFAAGTMYYWNTSGYYYRTGLYLKDKDTVNLSGSTNLSNNSIKVNNTLIQPGSNPPVSGRLTHISGSTLTFTNMSGQTTFENGLALQNTVSYFGGSQATLYALLNGAGAVTDLTSSDPGFVNVGYGANNTISFPSTLPSGNTPDVELPAGTTIQATVEFANSQGTVTADSNTLTPQ